ncbi:formate dehydrogenase, alpha subunit [Pseudonocardia dioxanivorans CB1190]|uniref:Formate dehydrogenase, alpha subunit n=1 Tax=Pseudonocardia dioxanivorans (strain ATCC 55486 / DSM 44775 / JCM 13855 / CB1190) TaxID=675635 RepID=F4CRF1_PSEUX|nr:formate dehydrogenase subunit alpha [Pseudonocardia dioxanivorans]AEA25242.1 formate dehydrogenase, alpha subunit [Pseudonocardia dioxanivorans CB1190]
MTLLEEPDFGTPARPGQATVEVTVDGVALTVPPGTSVMRAAAQAGCAVPKLCATDSLEAFGSCRLCVVEIDGARGTPASCTTPVAPGMVVRTRSEKLEKLRRGVMELYISDHPLDCLTCSANGDCELQDMAAATGLREVRYGSGVDAGANHMDLPKDTSNPYFEFDPAKCILCSRCVRACDEVQGTLALTIEGRGFGSTVSPGGTDFLSSDCVSCGACVQACPTATLQERSVVELGLPTRSVVTTCAYCGVGCSFKAEVRGSGEATEVVRMVPLKDGGANQGHSCVKGRFAFGYASHPDRVLAPRIRESISDDWREVSWEEAIGFAARRLRAIQAAHGPGSIGAITSSRCTNEEVYVVQKMVRAAFGNNNVDTCARVCHSPTGYGLNQTFGTSAGTQDFASVDDADVIMVIGANPTDAHPVFASRMKRRLRRGAALIVADPRSIDLVRSPHIEAAYHLPLAPGTNVAIVNAMAHVVVTEGLVDREFVDARCEGFDEWAAFIAEPANSPEAVEEITGVPAADVRAAARLYAGARNAAIYYGLGVTEHSQGSTMVMGMANLAMATGNIGRRGVGVNPLRGQNNVQGSCDMGSFPHELPGYRHVGEESVRDIYNELWGVEVLDEPGLRIPNMFDAALDGSFRALFVHGEDIAQSDPNTAHVEAALSALDLVIVQDLFENETARFAHVLLPGTSFLEKDGTFTNAERRINRVRPVMPARTGKQEWQIVCELAQAMGYPMHYDDAAQIMDEIALTTPTFSGVSFAHLDAVGSVQWPCTTERPEGTPIMHVDGFVRGLGRFVPTRYVPTRERSTRRFPLILTTGRILSQYNVGAQTRRTANVAWHPEDLLEIHPHDAEVRGIADGDRVELSSRVGTTSLRASISARMPVGVCYTTFHHPVSGANVVTTENSDWATNCPEYKVTAVQVTPATTQAAVERGEAPVGAGRG